jgi:hypothetical protein
MFCFGTIDNDPLSNASHDAQTVRMERTAMGSEDVAGKPGFLLAARPANVGPAVHPGTD